MRPLFIALVCLLAAPAIAWTGERLTPVTEAPVLAQAAPELDEDGCLALAKAMDAKEKAKTARTPKEEKDYEECVMWFRCDKADADWEQHTRTNEMLLRHVMASCGYKGSE